MTWIIEHAELVLLLISGGGLAFWLAWGKAAWRAHRAYQKEVDQRRDHVIQVTTLSAATWQGECTRLAGELDDLKGAFRNKVADCDARAEINEQDKYQIRLLKERLRESDIDYSDITEMVRRWKPTK